LSTKKNDRVRNSVRENYSRSAKDSRNACGCSPTCCGDAHQSPTGLTSLAMGSSAEDLHLIPESANMGLGCGNPQTISELKLVKELSSVYQSPGDYSVVWNGTNQNGSSVPSGIYFYQNTAGNQVLTESMLLLK